MKDNTMTPTEIATALAASQDGNPVDGIMQELQQYRKYNVCDNLNKLIADIINDNDGDLDAIKSDLNYAVRQLGLARAAITKIEALNALQAWRTEATR